MDGVQKMELSVQNRMKSMLAKMKPNKEYWDSEIDVYGTIDAQAFARLFIDKKIERVKGLQKVKLPTRG